MPSKNRISVKFSNDGIRKFIVTEQKKTGKSYSEIVEDLVISGMEQKGIKGASHPEKLLFRTKEKTAWSYYKDEIGHTTPLPNGKTSRVLEAINTEKIECEAFFSTEGYNCKVHKEYIVREIQEKLHEIAGSYYKGQSDKAILPRAVYILVTNVDVTYRNAGELPQTVVVDVRFQYAWVDTYYSKNRIHEYYLDMMNIRYMSYKSMATKRWSTNKYSHFVPAGLNKNIWDKSNYGTYFVGVLNEPMSPAEFDAQEGDFTDEYNVKFKIFIDNYIIKLRLKSFPTKDGEKWMFTTPRKISPKKEINVEKN